MTAVIATSAHTADTTRRVVWTRFRSDRWAMAGLCIVAFYGLVALFAPLVCAALGISPYALDRDALNDYGLPLGRLGGMSAAHPLGVEPGTGRDILARLVYGARVSLLIGLSAAAATMVLGVLAGLLAGYFRGRTDSVLSRLGDLTYTFPSLILVVALTRPATQRLEALGIPEGNPARIAYIVAVSALFGWVGIFRLIRSDTLAMREREFVEAARCSGAGSGHVLRRELLPNLWAPIIAIGSMTLPAFIGLEAALSFLGVGVIPPAASLGVMLEDSVHYYRADPMYFLIPGTTLFVLVMGFFLVGEGLRDALDPKMRR